MIKTLLWEAPNSLTERKKGRERTNYNFWLDFLTLQNNMEIYFQLKKKLKTTLGPRNQLFQKRYRKKKKSMTSKLSYNLIANRHIGASRGQSWKALTEHAQSWQSMNTKASKMWLLTLTSSGTQKPPSTGLTLSKKRVSESLLNVLHTVESFSS